jgi:PAS domain S-box-containing protein
VLATFVGGVRAGVLAAVLSALIANFAFVPPFFAFSTSLSAIVATALFLLVTAMLIGLVGVLNKAVDMLHEDAEATRFIIETEPAGVIAVDDTGTIELVNAAVEHQLGYKREELIGKRVETLVPAELRVNHAEFRADYMARPRPRQMGAGRDLHALRKDGSLVPVEIGLNPFQRNGRKGALATIIDISERKTLERRAEILSDEVRHRARNLLTIVRVVGRRTLPEQGQARFLGVLDALARTQDLFGGAATMSLRAIVEGELVGFLEQVSISGCDLELSARAAQDFSLIVHELTTNAIKYGALFLETGRIVVSGQPEDGGRYAFMWEERGGPAVLPPAHRGFGSAVLEDIPRAFAANVELEFRPEGLRYTLRAERDQLASVVELSPAAAH